MRQKKNVPTLIFLNKSLWFVEAQLELLKMEFANSIQEKPPTNNARRSNEKDYELILINVSDSDIIELSAALWKSKRVFKTTGEEANFVEIVDTICKAFNIEAKDIHTKLSRLFNRSKGATQFLDKLKSVLNIEQSKRLSK